MHGSAVVMRPLKGGGFSVSIKFVDLHGRQVWEPLGRTSDGVTREAARVRLRQREDEVRAGVYERPVPRAFPSFADRWFRDKAPLRRWKGTLPDAAGKGGKGTLGLYARQVRQLKAYFRRMNVDEIQYRHVKAFVDEMIRLGYAASTINGLLSRLHDILKEAERVGYVKGSNPVSLIERPRQPEFDPRILTPDELKRIRAAFREAIAKAPLTRPPRKAEPLTRSELRLVELAFWLGYYAALRRSEVFGARNSWIDLANCLVHVKESKTEEGKRKVALPSEFVKKLRRHMSSTPFDGPDDFLLIDPDSGRRLSVSRFLRGRRLVCELAGVDDSALRPMHDNRHSSLTHDAAGGATEFQIMAKAGHASPQTARRYIHLAGRVFPEMAERLGDTVRRGGKVGARSTSV